jgi:PAS domain-containing protein
MNDLFDGVTDLAKPINRRRDDSKAHQTKYRALYTAANAVVLHIGMDGEINSEHPAVCELMNALHDIDGGIPR